MFRFAYLDPGTGSMIIQSLIGVVAGVGLFGRKALNTLRGRNAAKSKKAPKDVRD